MWIKICANTCVEDALRAAELGADAVGFVFAPSARRVTPEQVRAIAGELPARMERVGVFVGGSAEEIAATAETARLTGVQLHSEFEAGLVERLGEWMPELAVIPVVHWEIADQDESVVAAAAGFDRVVGKPRQRVLVDAKVGRASGGLGVSFDWESAREMFAEQRERGLRLIVAGGLRPENVAEAIRVLRPWGVDVVSGVEREPGRKDPEKLRRFIENARRA